MSAIRRVTVIVMSAFLALGTVTLVASPAAVAKPARTVKKIVRPVHRDGTPVRGYRVVSEYHDPEYFDCSYVSPVSVSANVAWCGSTADYTMACWESTNYSVLCLRDPTKRMLVRIDYFGDFYRGRAPKHPAPQHLTLRKYGSCSIRAGGAWDRSKQHPNWYGYYGCTSKKRGYSAVYGPAKRRDGIVRKGNRWSVDLLRYTKDYEQQPMRRDRVKVAYYVGTAK